MALRRFEFAVDRLTIQPLEHSPVTRLNAKTQLQLPEDIRRLAAIPAAGCRIIKDILECERIVPVQRGDTELLPMKCQIQFNCTVTLLMDIIRAGAMLSIEVSHCSSHDTQQVIGRAHVPMQPLLSETWVQGRAPVWATMDTCTICHPQLMQ
eukprot:jgi/Ulvmu1/7940/UM004_0173.1